jgi:hypothetical protein
MRLSTPSIRLTQPTDILQAVQGAGASSKYAAIIGGICGTLAGLFLLVIGVWQLNQKQKRRDREKLEATIAQMKIRAGWSEIPSREGDTNTEKSSWGGGEDAQTVWMSEVDTIHQI